MHPPDETRRISVTRWRWTHRFSVGHVIARDLSLLKCDLRRSFAPAPVHLGLMHFALLGRFANSFVYYGLSLNSSNLGGNPYLNFLLMGAVELPACGYIWWSFTRFGRVRPFAYIFISAGVSLLAIMALPTGESCFICNSETKFNLSAQ